VSTTEADTTGVAEVGVSASSRCPPSPEIDFDPLGEAVRTPAPERSMNTVPGAPVVNGRPPSAIRLRAMSSSVSPAFVALRLTSLAPVAPKSPPPRRSKPSAAAGPARAKTKVSASTQNHGAEIETDPRNDL
jgi:hypothetical protein